MRRRVARKVLLSARPHRRLTRERAERRLRVRPRVCAVVGDGTVLLQLETEPAATFIRVVR